MSNRKQMRIKDLLNQKEKKILKNEQKLTKIITHLQFKKTDKNQGEKKLILLWMNVFANPLMLYIHKLHQLNSF